MEEKEIYHIERKGVYGEKVSQMERKKWHDSSLNKVPDQSILINLKRYNGLRLAEPYSFHPHSRIFPSNSHQSRREGDCGIGNR